VNGNSGLADAAFLVENPNNHKSPLFCWERQSVKPQSCKIVKVITYIVKGIYKNRKPISRVDA
jgi:hypothetical protein